MASGKYFNHAIYKKTLFRWWPLGLALAAAQCINFLDRLSGRWYPYFSPGVELLDSSLRTAQMQPVFALLMAMGVYLYLHSLRSSAAMAALPVRREAVFLSHGLAGLTLLSAAHVLTALITLLFCPAPVRDLYDIFVWLAVSLLLTVAYFGFASLCAVCTGHTLAVAGLYGLGLYAAVALESTARRVAQYVVFGLGGQHWVLMSLSPVYYLSHQFWAYSEPSAWDPATGEAIRSRVVFGAWGTVALYALAGVLFLALAVVLLRRRPNEAAGSVIALPWLRTLFRYGTALGAGCCAAAFVLEKIYGYNGYQSPSGTLPRVLMLLVLTLMGVFVGWFGADMLLRRTVRVFDRHWEGLAVVCGVLCVLVLGAEFDVLGVERRIPEEGKIGSARVTCYQAGIYYTNFYERENIAAVRALQQTVVENKALYERYQPRAAIGFASPGDAWRYDGGSTLMLQYFDPNGMLIMQREYNTLEGAMAWASNGDATWVTNGDAWASDGDAWASDGDAGYWAIPIPNGGRDNPALGQLEALANTAEAVEGRLYPWGVGRQIPMTACSGTVMLRSFNGQYYDFDQIYSLDSAEARELFEKALVPDSRDSSLFFLRLQPLDRDELPKPGNVSIYLNLGSWDENWFLDVRVTPDARRTMAWLRDHGMLLDADADLLHAEEWVTEWAYDEVG